MIPSLLLGSDYLAQEILRFLFFDQSFWKRYEMSSIEHDFIEYKILWFYYLDRQK